MTSIKTSITSDQFTNLFDKRYIKSLNEIRKTGSYSGFGISVSNIELSLRENSYLLHDKCYKIDGNLLIYIPLPSGPIDSSNPYLMNKYILFTEKFVSSVMMDGEKSIVINISGNKINHTKSDIEEIKNIIFKFINSKELTTEFMQVELIMDQNQTNFTVIGEN